MRWFKHMNDLLDQPDLQMILDKHGPIATDGFIRLMEFAARHFDVKNPGIYITSWRDFCSKVFPICGKNKAKTIMETYQDFAQIKFTILGDELLLEFPEIKNLGDEYSRKRRKKKGDE